MPSTLLDEGAKPPLKYPQVMLFEFSRSPTFDGSRRIVGTFGLEAAKLNLFAICTERFDELLTVGT